MKYDKIQKREERRQKGSATVMVIMMVMTLMLFSVFSMMSSYAGLSIARTNAEWTQLYYHQESQAAESMANLHHTLHNVWQEMEVDDQGWQQQYYQEILGYMNETKGVQSIHLLPGSNTAVEMEGGLLIPADPEAKTKDFQVEFKVYASAINAPEIRITAWKSIPETFEYDDEIQFRDVEVD